MPITKADLIAALQSLTADEAAPTGFRKTPDSPFKPPAATPDRVKQLAAGDRWFQLQVGGFAAEFHATAGGAVIHRYQRTSAPGVPQYLLDGFAALVTLDASDLQAADDTTIWTELARVAPSNGGRVVLTTYAR